MKCQWLVPDNRMCLVLLEQIITDAKCSLCWWLLCHLSSEQSLTRINLQCDFHIYYHTLQPWNSCVTWVVHRGTPHLYPTQQKPASLWAQIKPVWAAPRILKPISYFSCRSVLWLLLQSFIATEPNQGNAYYFLLVLKVSVGCVSQVQPNLGKPLRNGFCEARLHLTGKR